MNVARENVGSVAHDAMLDVVVRWTPIRIHVVFVHWRPRPGVSATHRVPEHETQTLRESLVHAELKVVDLDDVAKVIEQHPRAICNQRTGSAGHSSIDVARSWKAQSVHMDVVHRE